MFSTSKPIMEAKWQLCMTEQVTWLLEALASLWAKWGRTVVSPHVWEVP